MKRKDLEDLGLEKEAVDKIMDWNGADIEAEKAKVKTAEGERDNYKSQLDTATAELNKLKDMKPEEMRQAIAIINGRAETECSGNVTKENIQNLIDLGVDYISCGALTHSAPILDISLKNLHAY